MNWKLISSRSSISSKSTCINEEWIERQFGHTHLSIPSTHVSMKNELKVGVRVSGWELPLLDVSVKNELKALAQLRVS